VFRRGRVTATIIAAVAAVVAIGGIAFVLVPHGHARATSRGATAQAQALRVVSVTPAAGTLGVNGAAPIRLTLAQAVSAGSGTGETALPVISPAIPGSWHQAGTALTFTPATGFAPRTHVTITVPHQAWTASYTTGSYSLLRLQQLLAQLGYLPLSWTADSLDGTAQADGTAHADDTTQAGGTTQAGDAAAQLADAYQPPAGVFSWQPGYPWRLHDFWQPGQMNLITSGAIMAFQSDHGMVMTGEATAPVWTAVLRADAAKAKNPSGYTYAIASQYQPETLTIWHDGREVFHSYANTGIPVSPTTVGTFPVYLRYRFQIMQGTNPDGSHYADPVQFVSYFHGGEAVHYFPRYSYGWEQSLGCVELPLDPAAQAWPYLTYGSLVTVTPE
jgi:peptidoglycan hydrolase-like protein with peptidoglycan-binding domain